MESYIYCSENIGGKLCFTMLPVCFYFQSSKQSSVPTEASGNQCWVYMVLVFDLEWDLFCFVLTLGNCCSILILVKIKKKPTTSKEAPNCSSQRTFILHAVILWVLTFWKIDFQKAYLVVLWRQFLDTFPIYFIVSWKITDTTFCMCDANWY